MCRGPSPQMTHLRVPARAARHPKPHRLGGSDHRTLFSRGSSGCRPKTKASADSGSGEGSPPGWQTAALLLRLHGAFPRCTGRSACHLPLTAFLPSSNAARLRVRCPCTNLAGGGGITIPPTTPTHPAPSFAAAPRTPPSLHRPPTRAHPCTPVHARADGTLCPSALPGPLLSPESSAPSMGRNFSEFSAVPLSFRCNHWMNFSLKCMKSVFFAPCLASGQCGPAGPGPQNKQLGPRVNP